MDYVPGNIVHCEIPAPDIGVAKAFYARLFDWKTWPLHDGYEFFDAGNLAGAFDAEKAPTLDGTVITVMAGDVGDKLAEVEAAGGRVLQSATEIPGGRGWYGYFADPAGNRVGLWAPAEDVD